MSATPGCGDALARVHIIEVFADDNRGAPIIEVAIVQNETQPSVRDVEQLARLLTIAPLLYARVVDLPLKGRSRFIAIGTRSASGAMAWRFVWDGNETKAGLKRFQRAVSAGFLRQLEATIREGRHGVQNGPVRRHRRLTRERRRVDHAA